MTNGCTKLSNLLPGPSNDLEKWLSLHQEFAEQGRNFHDAALALSRSDGYPNLYIPFFMCLSFAIECLSKSIIIIRRPDRSLDRCAGHATKELIFQALEDRPGESPKLLLQKFRKKVEEDCNFKNTDFDDTIEYCSKQFINIRYAQEKYVGSKEYTDATVGNATFQMSVFRNLHELYKDLMTDEANKLNCVKTRDRILSYLEYIWPIDLGGWGKFDHRFDEIPEIYEENSDF